MEVAGAASNGMRHSNGKRFRHVELVPRRMRSCICFGHVEAVHVGSAMVVPLRRQRQATACSLGPVLVTQTA